MNFVGDFDNFTDHPLIKLRRPETFVARIRIRDTAIAVGNNSGLNYLPHITVSLGRPDEGS